MPPAGACTVVMEVLIVWDWPCKVTGRLTALASANVGAVSAPKAVMAPVNEGTKIVLFHTPGDVNLLA